MSEQEEKDLHKEIKKNRWNNWLFQGIILAIVGVAVAHFWDAGTTYMKDRPIREAREELTLAKIDTVIGYWKQHARADYVRDSLEDVKWNTDNNDKAELTKKIDGMQDVQISMLNTISSIQNRISNRTYMRCEDE